MEAAMEVAASGSVCSISLIAKIYNVPPTSLKDRMSRCVLHGKKPGPLPYT